MKSIEIKVPILSIDKIDDVGTLDDLYDTFEIIEVLQRNLALTFVEHFFAKKEFEDVIALTFHKTIADFSAKAVPLFSYLEVSNPFQEIEDDDDLAKVIWNSRYTDHGSAPLYFGIQEIIAKDTIEYFSNHPIQLARQFKELSSFIITRQNFQLVHQQCFTEKQYALLEKILLASQENNKEKGNIENHLIQQLIHENKEVKKAKTKI
jgi:hypothetical protein